MSYNYNNYCNPYREDYQWNWVPITRGTCENEKKILTARYDTLNKEYGDYKTNYSTKNTDYQTLQRNYDSIRNTTCPPNLSGELAILNNRFSTLNANYTSAQTELENLRSKTSTCEQDRNSLASLNSQFNSYKAECSKLNSNYQTLQTRYDSIRNTTCPPNLRGELDTLNNKYQDLQRSYTSNQAELANLRSSTSTCNQDRESLTSLQKKYQDLVAENSMLRSSTCPPYVPSKSISEPTYVPSKSISEPTYVPPTFKLLKKQFNKDEKYKVTKRGVEGWDIYETIKPNDEQLLELVNKFFNTGQGTGAVAIGGFAGYKRDEITLAYLDNLLYGGGSIQLEYTTDNEVNRKYIFNRLKDKYDNDTSEYKKLSPFYQYIGSLEIKDIQLTQNQRFQKNPNAVQTSENSNAVQTSELKKDIDILKGKINKLKRLKVEVQDPSGEVRYFRERADRNSPNYDPEDEKIYNDDSYFASSYDKKDHLGSGFHSSNTMRYEVPINFINNPIIYNPMKIDNCNSTNIQVKDNNYVFNDYGLECMISKLEADSINLQRKMDGNRDPRMMNQRWMDPSDPRMMNQRWTDPSHEFDTTYNKYISILGREFQFYEYPEQYEGKTLEELKIGDSFTIIDRL